MRLAILISFFTSGAFVPFSGYSSVRAFQHADMNHALFYAMLCLISVMVMAAWYAEWRRSHEP